MKVDMSFTNEMDLSYFGTDVVSEWATNCTTCTVPCILSHIRNGKVVVWCLQRGWWGAHIGCEYYKEGLKRLIPNESEDVRIGEMRNIVELNEDFWNALRRNGNGTN